ncbi:Retrovirus-related Pol polyprotein from transposon 412 [Labeo rohita]|nr:Retrovirus-related Pol polyprotein from transposon 412 [Labeo rohita]
MTEHDITLHPKRVIAEMAAAHVLPLKPDVLSCSNHLSSGKLVFNLNDSPIPEEWKKRISDKLNSLPEVFAVDELSYGHTTAVKHHIRLQDETPFKERPRPIHPSDREAVRQHLRELLDAKIIRESESPFASPIVLVRKKNGQIRLCVDYRKLNMRTIKDAYALPNIEETFSALSGAKWFSVMDLKSGYYQVEVADEDKHKTAFVCPLGFFEFNRLPQGVTNAPSTFMEKCVGDLHLSEVLVFLDDLIVFSKTLEEHETRLMKVLNRLKEFGLKLSPDKCQFFKSSLKYLGHIVDADGVHTDPEKISALKDRPCPSTRRELKCFLGFAGYYRRFVEGYSKITKPLNCLTAGYNSPRKRGKIYKREKPNTPVNPNFPFGEEWTVECESAFRTLIDKLTSAPILAFANPQLPYVLHTDACREGLGAALYQEQEGKLRVIAYASRGLSKSERNYPTHKLEYLALKWAVCEKFSDYLYGTEFTVLTDNNPLTYVLTTAKLDAAGHRWLAQLSTYRFNIKYRAGSANKDADGLSRRPQSSPEEDDAFLEEERAIEDLKRRLCEETEIISTETLFALSDRHSVVLSSEVSDAPEVLRAESLALNASSVPESFACPGYETIPGMTRDDWYRAQREDSSLKRIISFVELDQKPNFRQTKLEPLEVKLLLREWNRLELRDGVLYRKWTTHRAVLHQIVLPQQCRERALKGVHDEVGHLGYERALDLARARFFWPKMARDIEDRCRTCERCFRSKANPQKAAPMESIQTTFPLELVCMDYLSLEPDNRDIRNILVITDHFTKFAVAIPTKDQKAKTIAKAFWENFIVHYGFPSRLLSDQGRDFESHTVRELCALIGADKVRTTPYHPRGNPVERFNRTLLSMLGTLEEKDKHHWRDFVKPLVHAYNCTRNDTTGYSPYELMFGRQAKLPIDLAFGINPPGERPKTHSEYVKKLRERLQESYELASDNSRKMSEKNKARFDLKVRAAELMPGDRVLVRNLSVRGKHKLADRWEKMVHTVVKRISDGPVYVVKPEKSSGPYRTLHRDLLLPCGFLPASPEEQMPETTLNVNRKHKMRTRASTEVREGDECEEQSSDEEEGYFQIPIPEIVTRSPLIKRVDDRSPNSNNVPVKSSDQLNPHAVEFAPRTLPMPRSESNQPVVEPTREAFEIVTGGAPVLPVSESVEIENDPDYVTIEIPEEMVPDSGAESPELSHSSVDTESVPLRRSGRERRPPKTLEYEELGKPILLALTSFFDSLGNILAASLVNTHAGTHAV